LKAVTVTEVKGYGQQKGTAERYRGKEYAAEFLPKVKLEVAIDDADLERAIEAIMSSARTGKLGDGKIIVHELVEVVRIRTGETGKQAL
jgi:nitrogen regulatory protein P-II 2